MKKISYILLPVLMFASLFGNGAYASSIPNAAMMHEMHNNGRSVSAECNLNHGCAATEHCSLCFEQNENSVRDAVLQQAGKLSIKYNVWKNTYTGAIASGSMRDHRIIYGKLREKIHDRDRIVGSVLKKE